MKARNKKLEQKAKSWEENVLERSMRAPYDIAELMGVDPRRYAMTTAEAEAYFRPYLGYGSSPTDAEILRDATKEPSMYDLISRLSNIDNRDLFQLYGGYSGYEGHPSFGKNYNPTSTFPRGIPAGWWN